MDVGTIVSSSIIGGCAWDFVKYGLTISGGQLKDKAKEKLIEWTFDDQATERIANRINENSYLENESEEQYCQRLSQDAVLNAMLEQFSNPSTQVNQSAHNSPNSVLVGGGVENLTINNHQTSTSNKQPKIMVAVEPEQTLSIDSSLSEFAPLAVPKFINIKDFPEHLQDFIEIEEIDSYNRKLPSQQEIEEHNDRAKLYFSSVKHTIKPQIVIRNEGIASTNQVIVTMIFPKIVKVLHKEDVQLLTEPKISIPESPLSNAHMKYEKHKKSKYGVFLAQMDRVHSLMPEAIAYGHIIQPLQRVESIARIMSGIDISNNVVTIQKKNIMHTRESICDDIVLVPIDIGESMIDVSVICEEYNEKERFQIPLIVS